MVREILFTDERFDTNGENNLLCEMTENTIILCPNYQTMAALAQEIFNTINGNAEHNEYNCDDEDVGQAKYLLNFGLQKVIGINEQTIILCLEPAMVYNAKCIEDIWFVDCSRGKEQIYPMSCFINSDEVWGKGLEIVYKTIVCGKYGCYDGSWVNIRSE